MWAAVATAYAQKDLGRPDSSKMHLALSKSVLFRLSALPFEGEFPGIDGPGIYIPLHDISSRTLLFIYSVSLSN